MDPPLRDFGCTDAESTESPRHEVRWIEGCVSRGSDRRRLGYIFLEVAKSESPFLLLDQHGSFRYLVTRH